MDEDYMRYQTCVIRQLMERHFECEYIKICDDITKIICPCGCIAIHTHDDTPGFRINEYNINCSNCLLKHHNNTIKGE